jgi:nitronate monooxygenase/enoyl-[acyl-carrier protein] reductase II
MTAKTREVTMLRTRFCDLFDAHVPVLQAPIWPATSPELVAAVGEAGAVGSIGAVFTPAGELRRQIARVRELTERPFVVNHVVPALDEEAFEATLDERPAAVSFALGDPGGLVDRVHELGIKVIEQVHTVAQARQAAERGVDVIVAQGGEAGGQGMLAGASAMVLAPQVVDAVAPIPVLVAGAVADGRGLAAALVLGADGANVGTRFLASDEAGVDPAWKRRIVETESEDAVRFEPWSAIMPSSGRGYDVVPRVIRTGFVDEWRGRAPEAPEHADELRSRIMGALRSGEVHELTPFSGQTVGLIHDVRPAGDIVRAMAAEAEEALARISPSRAS